MIFRGEVPASHTREGLERVGAMVGYIKSPRRRGERRTGYLYLCGDTILCQARSPWAGQAWYVILRGQPETGSWVRKYQAGTGVVKLTPTTTLRSPSGGNTHENVEDRFSKIFD